MEWVETTAKSVEDARARALDLLGVDASDAEIEVIDEGKVGLFGRVKVESRVRARVKPKAPPARDDRRRNNNRGGGRGSNRGGGGGGGRGGNNRNRNKSGNDQGGRGGNNRNDGGRDGGSNRDGGRGGKNQGQKQGQGRNQGQRQKQDGGNNRDGGRNRDDRNRDDRNSNRNDGGRDGGNNRDGGGRNRDDRNDGGRRRKGAAAAGAGAVAAGTAAAVSGGNEREDGGRDRNDRNNNNRNGGGDNRRRNNKNDGNNAKEKAQEKVVDEEFSGDEQQEVMHEFVVGLAEIFDGDASVEMTDDGENLEAHVSGADVGLMIGPSGATLSAVEELTRTVMQRAAAGRRYRRLRVDVDGYRERRREALIRFSTGLAEKVAESGEELSLEPMNPADRKIVHDTIAAIDGVNTLSEGNDPRRYVVIVAERSGDEEE